MVKKAADGASQKEEWGAARPTGARHAGSDGQKRSVGAAMNADTRPGARPRTPLAAAMLIPSPWTRPPIQAGRPGLATVHPSNGAAAGTDAAAAADVSAPAASDTRDCMLHAIQHATLPCLHVA